MYLVRGFVGEQLRVYRKHFFMIIVVVKFIPSTAQFGWDLPWRVSTSVMEDEPKQIPPGRVFLLLAVNEGVSRVHHLKIVEEQHVAGSQIDTLCH